MQVWRGEKLNDEEEKIWRGKEKYSKFAVRSFNQAGVIRYAVPEKNSPKKRKIFLLIM
jgi:hypothetical protein